MAQEPKTFDQIDQWKSTMFLYSSALKSINTKIEILNNEYIQLYNYNPIEHITSRLKTPASIVKKLQHDGKDVTIENMVEYLNDIAGIRIICSFMSDIYPIADMIARQADITVLHVKDYIKYPKSNGYKSYHMVVTIPVYLRDGKVDTRVEIQIRTIAMDFWASLEHKIAYKFEGNPPDYMETELKAVFSESGNYGDWQESAGRRTKAGRRKPQFDRKSSESGGIVIVQGYPGGYAE